MLRLGEATLCLVQAAHLLGDLALVDCGAEECPCVEGIRRCQDSAVSEMLIISHGIAKGEALLWLHLSFFVGFRKLARLSQLTALILLTRRQAKPQPNIGSKYLINMVLCLNTSCI